MDADKLDKIRRRCDDAQGGYSGMREVDYARDVRLLLAERDALEKTLATACERADLWQRDCEAAQARVKELENRTGTLTTGGV